MAARRKTQPSPGHNTLFRYGFKFLESKFKEGGIPTALEPTPSFEELVPLRSGGIPAQPWHNPDLCASDLFKLSLGSDQT